MANWFDELQIDVFRVWARNASVPLLISGKDGDIFWANPAFEEWSGYTQGELRALGWKKLSKPDESLDADIAAMTEVLEGNRIGYTVQKYYIPKGDRPQPGELSAVRYPLGGEIEFFLCTWHPLKNGTQAAFELAVRHIAEVDKTVAALTQHVEKLTQRSEDEDWLVNTSRLIRRYPKIAAAVLAFGASLFGLNNALELLQRLSVVGVPVPPSVKETDAMQMPQSRPISAFKIAETGEFRTDAKLTTPGGSKLEWSSENAQLPRPVGNSGLDGSGSRFISGGG